MAAGVPLRWPLLAPLVVVAGVSSLLAIGVAPMASPLSPWWPGAGFGLAVLLLCAKRHLPYYVVALVVVLTAANHLGGVPLDRATLLGAADLVETTLIAMLLRHGRPTFRLRTFADGWQLFGSATIGTLVGALLLTTITAVDGNDAYAVTFLTLSASHLASVMLVVPLLLLLWEGEFSWPRASELLIQTMVLTLTVLAVFMTDLLAPVTWLPIPLLLWSAARFGSVVTAIQTIVTSLAVLGSVLRGVGPFVIEGQPWYAAPLLGDAYAIALVLASIPLSLALTDHTSTLEILRTRGQELESEIRFSQSILDATADMVILIDRAGRTLAANQTCAELTGWSEEELIDQGALELLTPPPVTSQERLDAILETVEAGDSIEIQVVVRDGSQRQVQIRAMPLPRLLGDTGLSKLSDRTMDAFVIVGVDVTAERNAAGWLLHILRTDSAMAIIGCDLKGQILIFSRGAERITGRPATNLEGHSITTLFRAEESGRAPTVHELVGQDFAEAVPPSRDWWMTAPETDVLVSLTTSRISDSYGRAIGHLLIAHDVTDSREAARKLLELDATRHEFVSTASHEIRTPMTSVIGFAEMLAEGAMGELNPRQQEVVDAITRNGNRLLVLAEDLLTVAKFDSSAPTPRPTRMDLRTVVVGAVSQHEGAAAMKQVTVEVKIPATPAPIVGNGSDLQRVLANLVSNAVKFSPSGGHVQVSLDMTDDQIRITVRDHGMGIPERDLPRIFDRFYRASNAVLEASQGTGLGLAIASTIIEEHGGSIRVESAQGAGACFTVLLPAASGAVTRPAVAEAI